MWQRGTKAKSCPLARRFQGSFRSCCGSASLRLGGSSDSCNLQLEEQFAGPVALWLLIDFRMMRALCPKHNLSRATVTASPTRGVSLSERKGAELCTMVDSRVLVLPF